jgi:hypothetical protein
MLVDMTTSEYVYTRPADTEDVLTEQDWPTDTKTSRERGSVLAGLRRRLVSLRQRRSGRVHPRPARPTRHAHRADFIERAAMSREMHRL